MMRMMELTVGELTWSGRRARRAGVAGRGRATLLKGSAAEAGPATPARRACRPLLVSSPTVSFIILIVLIFLWIILPVLAFHPYS